MLLAVICWLALAGFGFGFGSAVLHHPHGHSHTHSLLPLPRPAAPSVPRRRPCLSRARLSVPGLAGICPQSHCLYFPRCSPPFVLRLVSPPACCDPATRPVAFLLTTLPHTYTRSLLLYLHAHAQRHAPCCPPPHHPRHGPLDIHPIAKQCPPPARMGDQQCHVKSINTSRQCNTATPAPALLLWHTYTAGHPPTKQSLAPE